jgi:hypothetical protein
MRCVDNPKKVGCNDLVFCVHEECGKIKSEAAALREQLERLETVLVEKAIRISGGTLNGATVVFLDSIRAALKDTP